MRRALSAFDAIRAAVFLCGLGPLARLVWLGTHDGLTANPVEFVTRSTGTWALVFLCLSLMMTPLRRLIGWSQCIRLRRMLGLYCFFYALLHVALWVWIEHAFALADMGRDVLKRPFVTAGFAAFVLLVPLAATSTQAMMRRLGKRWTALHRTVYAVAVAAILHFAWHKAGKNDFGEVSLYAAAIAWLLGIRLWWALRPNRAAASAPAPRRSAPTSPRSPG